jgi:hypothetical protein
VELDIIDGKYKPENSLGHGPDEFRSTLFNLSIGLFASLMDKHTSATNVFDVWVALFPEKEQRIREVWKKVEPHIGFIRQFRSDVAFHANKNLAHYLRTRRSLQEKSAELVPAMQEFLDLAAELIKEQHKALPDFGKEIEPILKKAVPGASPGQIERLKSIFITR